MKTLAALLLLSVFLVLEVYQASTAFSFPSIIDDARDAMMKFSTGTTGTGGKVSTTTGHGVTSSARRRRRMTTTRRRRSKPSTGTYFAMMLLSTHKYVQKIGASSPKHRRTKPSNTFLEVLGKVERSILEAQASGNRRTSLRKLTSSIKLALTKRGYLFARQTLGQALYSALVSGRGKRSSGNLGKQYLINLKKELGEKAFNKLIGFNDDKTLIFAIDDTGSMSGEINAVKDISIAMVNALKGKEGIDYILSVFNDPNVGPTVRFEDGKRFIQKLKTLRAHDGDDYPELTFTGMQRAMEKGPTSGSPMFVFTDATAKDHSKYKDTLIQFATDFGVNINFLIRGSAASFDPFVQTARETCGMILRLTDSREIKKLTSIAMLSLKNFACMSDSTGSGSMGKRSLPKSHVISVDDSVEKMIVSISTANSNPVVTLRDPKGRVQHSGKISLVNAILYELYNPIPGRWTLTVGTSAGKYHYLVRGTSKTNIDFDYYFVMVPIAGKKVPIPISQPLSGQVANAIITVTGVEQIQTNNLKMDLLDSNSDRVLSTLTLTPRRKSKAHFTVSFTPPATPFRFQLRGKTLAGNTFMRSSRKTIKPITALIRVYKAMNGLLAIPRGRRMYVIMKIFNNGPTEKFEVSINDPLKYMTSRRKQVVKVYSKRDRRFAIWFSTSRSAKPGKAYPVAVKIKGRKSGVEAAQVLNMIVSN